MVVTPTESLCPDWKAREAASLVNDARVQLTQLKQQLAEVDRLGREALELRASRLPWDPDQLTTQLIALERKLSERYEETEGQIEKIVSLLTQALELQPQNVTARGKLADLYWLLFSRAEERGDTVEAMGALALLTAHDDGRYADLVEGTGTIQVDTDPPGARILLWDDAGEIKDLGQTPLGPVDIPPGNYRLEVRAGKEFAPAWRPIQVHRGDDVQVRIRLFAVREVGPDFRHVPAGRFVFGGDVDSPGAGPADRTFIDNYAIARHPVTVGEYMLFLDDLSGRNPGKALAFSPLPIPAERRANDPRLPVTGISHHAAREYCDWLSARTGIPHRLPTEMEWEKAARGVDGRPFPWGNRFDPSLCHTRRSMPGPPRKANVGTVPTDVSVYGVCDVAGGVHEWTDSPYGDSGLNVVRGGAFDDGVETCRCAARIPATAEAQVSIGFRLVRSLPRGGGDQITPAPIPTLSGDEMERSQSQAAVDPITSPVPPVKESLDLVLGMSRRLAASTEDPQKLLPQLLSETVELVHAERGLLLRRTEDRTIQVVEARTPRGEPIPPTDHGYDTEVVNAALKQRRSITLADRHPMLVVPLPDGESCLFLARRFHRKARFEDECELVATAAADPLALALRLCDR